MPSSIDQVPREYTYAAHSPEKKFQAFAKSMTRDNDSTRKAGLILENTFFISAYKNTVVLYTYDDK